MAGHKEEEMEHLLLQPQRFDDSDATPIKPKRWITRNIVPTTVGLLCVVTIVFICLERIGNRYKEPFNDSFCTTPACIHASSEILYNLSPNYKSIDPCTNFDELVCGGWSDRHDLRPDQGAAFTGTIMSETSEALLRHILEGPYTKSSNHSSLSLRQSHPSLSSRAATTETLTSIDEDNFIKLKSAYYACMDLTKIKNKGAQPLIEIINQVMDMFPVTQWSSDKRTPLTDADNKGLSETITYLQKIGIPGLVYLDVGPDDKNPDIVLIQESPPGEIGLPSKDYYKNEAVVEKYTETLSQVLSNLNLDHKNDEEVTKDKWKSMKSYRPTIVGTTDQASEVVDLEKKLSAATPDAADRNDVTKYYNLLSLEAADKLTPQISLSKIINSLIPSGFSAQNIIVTSPEYMKNLSIILNESSKEIVQTYLIWQCIQAFALSVEAEELKPYLRFMNELQGKEPDSVPDRWRRCVSHVDNGLGWILSHFYVEKAFSERAKSMGDQIVLDIKETFIQKLQEASWMDPSVIKLAIEKVHKIVQKIGYPSKNPNIMDPKSLRDFYGSVNITTTNFFNNSLLLARFDVTRRWSSLGKPVDRDEWGLTVPTVNAYYSPPGNEIVFPAGILQFPVFEAELPNYLNYGAFGSIAGHELSHAFDSSGRHYNQDGNYTDWWTNSTITNFEKRAQCFVGQYAEYTITGPDDKPLHVNGKLTLGENIADAGGVAAAFSAWKKRQPPTLSPKLPGLEHFSPEQLFFVSYGNWWCGKSRRETAISRIYTDPHAPNWVRILGTMANSRDFRKSFKCAVKEPVCELW